MRRTLLVLFVIVLVVGLLGFAAHSLDLVGMIARAHQPPGH